MNLKWDFTTSSIVAAIVLAIGIFLAYLAGKK